MSMSSAVCFSTYSTAFWMCSGFRFFGSGTAPSGPTLGRGCPVQGESGKQRNRLFGHAKIARVLLDSDAFVPYSLRSGDSRTAAHEWVKNDAVAERQSGCHELAHQ